MNKLFAKFRIGFKIFMFNFILEFTLIEKRIFSSILEFSLVDTLLPSKKTVSISCLNELIRFVLLNRNEKE